MKIRLTIALLLAPPFVSGAAQHAQVAYPDLGASAGPVTITADSSGNLFVVSYVTEPSGKPQIRVTKTDSKGTALAALDFGGSATGLDVTDTIAGAATDAQGDVVIAGTTSSADFPLVSPLISNTSAVAAFVIKIDSTLHTILFSTRLGGTTSGSDYRGGTAAGGLTIDKNGNIYVTGGTGDTDFPLSSGAFQASPPARGGGYAFLTGISSDGTKLLFSTYFGDSRLVCAASCSGAVAFTFGAAVVVDAAGDAVIAGTTDSNHLPTTPGVYSPNCGDCSDHSSTGFVAKFAAGGTKLLWATYLPVTAPASVFAAISIQSIALDSSGSVVIGGYVDGRAQNLLPITPGALQEVPPDPLGLLDGFVSKLDSVGEQLLFSTYFGGTNGGGNGVSGLIVDAQDRIWVAGSSEPATLPAPKNIPVLGSRYVAELTSDGSALADLFTLPMDGLGGSSALVAAGTVGIVALGGAGSLLMVSPGAGPSIVGIGNAAAEQVAGAVAPYELVSLYGLGIGPSTPMSSKVVDGAISTSLGGFQVTFNGVPSPLLFVGPTQINAIVPGEVYGSDQVTIKIVRAAGTVATATMPVRPSQPGVFHTQAPALFDFLSYADALNQDGTPNSAANPAGLGSIVTIWATGGGVSSRTLPDGVIVQSPMGAPALPVSIFSGPSLGVAFFIPGEFLPSSDSLEVLYAGDAVGMVEGVLQINFRLPSQSVSPTDLSFSLQIGDATSNGFTLYTKP